MDNAAKILLLGKTGAGKSSFINYFLGKTVAKAAAGKPVTEEYFIPYEIEDGRYPVQIFDTKGLEALGANEQLKYIIDGIKRQNNSDDIFNWFHTIFYCVSMTTRFEDFEANFIRTLQRELTQHIHIILTHCDSCAAETIEHMRERIKTQLKETKNIEIFEVVCVSKKKRNGQVVEPYGKEIISECVFDLLLGDIAFKLSCDYAKTLWQAFSRMLDDVFSQLDRYIDEAIRIGTLFDFIVNTDETESRLERRFDEVFSQLDNTVEAIQKRTDEKFTKILRPASQLYASYKGIVDNSYVESANLTFLDTWDWVNTDWLDKLDENEVFAGVLPRIAPYLDKDGKIPNEPSLSDILHLIGAGIGDLVYLKKNLKKFTHELRRDMMHRVIPSQNELQANAYKSIVSYIKPACF